MSMNDGGELTVLGSGVLAVIASAKNGKFPATGGQAIVATVGLVTVFSIGGSTRAAPVFKALSWLILMGVAWKAIPAFQASKTTTTKAK